MSSFVLGICVICMYKSFVFVFVFYYNKKLRCARVCNFIYLQGPRTSLSICTGSAADVHR